MLKSVSTVAVLALALMVSACTHRDKTLVSSYDTQCIEGVLYFIGAVHSPSSPVIDRDTLQPKTCNP